MTASKSVPPTAVRTYTFHYAGKPYAHTFPHIAEMGARENNEALNQAFHSWLEERWPGAFAAGRVHLISFVDHLVTDVSMT